MSFLIHRLLIGGLLIMIVEADPIRHMKRDIKTIIKCKIPNISELSGHNLTLTEKGKIGVSNRVIVWKGLFDEIPVAIKITWEEQKWLIDREMRILTALNAAEDPSIEKHGIPKVYYHGPIIGGYYAIAMSLCDETIEDRYILQDEQFSEASILLILKQAIDILEYMHRKNVVHNDIKPDNMFFRGAKVLIGDFGCAALNGEQIDDHTAKFASSSIYVWPTPKRYPRDDLESLVYSIWYFLGCDSLESDGYELLQSERKGKAEEKITEKCENIKNPDVRNAVLVCALEMISKEELPDYKRMNDVLTEAIRRVKNSLGPLRFEWLPKNIIL